jgi:phosphodiesterase/alkaline phosphatase D-like protein
LKRKLSLLLVLAAVVGVATGVAVAASSPSVSTGSATKIKDTNAVLNGQVNPNGSSTQYWFAWGLTSSYSTMTGKHSAGSGSGSVSVHLTTSGLSPGTKYHYRLFAQNRFGLSSGSDRTFTTAGHPLPGVITGSAITLSASGATLTGTVVPNNQSTTWEFQYGLSAGLYGVTTAGGTIAGGTAPVSVTEPISGLQAGTTFHYRLVAVHRGFPSTDGLDQTFTTFPASRPYPSVHASTAPHRARNRPFVFNTTGSVSSSAFPSAAECNGIVALRYFLGKRQIAARFATVEPNCTFSHQATFGHTFAFVPGHRRPNSERIRLQINFRGNNYLAAKRARDEHVFLR